MSTPNYYAIIPANVRYCKNLEPNAKLLYGEITALTHKEGYCWASNSYFAELYDVDDRTIRRWLESLRDNGFIVVDLDKVGLKTERKIWISQEMFTKGQKCHSVENNSTTKENASTDTFQRADKNVLVERTKMSSKQYNVLSPIGDKTTTTQQQEQQVVVAPLLATASGAILAAASKASEIAKSELAWELPDGEIAQLMTNYGIEYVEDQLNYMLKYSKKIKNPLEYLVNCCKKNYAKAKRDKTL